MSEAARKALNEIEDADNGPNQPPAFPRFPAFHAALTNNRRNGFAWFIFGGKTYYTRDIFWPNPKAHNPLFSPRRVFTCA